jgi:predicted phosphate transport protein (TIGR00153 family)
MELNLKIGKFLDIISDSLSLFEKEIECHLQEDFNTFKETFERICVLESEADELETDIKIMLYKFLLLPDTRADVLAIVKSLDNIIDATEAIAKDFSIQKPKFPDSMHKSILLLTKNTIASAESLLLATRAFFSEVHLVSAHVNKVNFFEHEADILEDKINMALFNDGIITDLAEKIQLKYFISKIASISDEAEKIGEKITIFSIKREI